MIIGASLSEPHTSESFVLLTIHKKLRIKIGELTNASAYIITTSIFARVMIHDGVDYTTSIFAHVMVHDTVHERSRL